MGDKKMDEDKKEMDQNTIFIGKKNTMSYVLAVITQFNQNADMVTIKARGKTISKAVDVSEIVKNKFVNS
jgi:DNA-binding protein